MSEVRKITFLPSVGNTVEIPDDVRRVDVQRTGGGAQGAGTLRISVVGFGELIEHVLLTADDGDELESGAQVAGVDHAHDTLWYMLARSAYGGGD